MSIALELRERYPDWAKITPAKQRILQYLVNQGGETQFWPGALIRSMGPRQRLEYVGFIETWQRAEDRYATTRITADGRAALAATETLTIGRKTYRRFIPWPEPITDGTLRCIACGQIDEPEWHDNTRCPALGAYQPDQSADAVGDAAQVERERSRETEPSPQSQGGEDEGLQTASSTQCGVAPSELTGQGGEP